MSSNSHPPARCTFLTRRQAVGASLAAYWTTGAAEFAAADAFEARSDIDEHYDATVDLAIRRGLDLLISRQTAEGDFTSTPNGSWAGVCALIGLAWLSRGARPGRGASGKALGQVKDYILSCVQSNGFISSRKTSHGPMYDHGFGTLFLAEVYGQDHDSGLRRSLELAVRLILRSQNSAGGWRYNPTPSQADLSVTASQMMALRAAKNAGIEVPRSVIDDAVAYVRRSQNPDGGFMYQIKGGSSRFALTAAAIVALYSAGIYEGPEVEQAFDYLRRNAKNNRRPGREQFFFYAHYYSAQAFWHLGGEEWEDWYRMLKKSLLPLQNSSGGWFDINSVEYGTAMSCLILNMPRTVLPIFQR